MENKKIEINLNPTKKNIVIVMVEWDMNDADYNTKVNTFDYEEFFTDEKLLLALAYVSQHGDGIADELEYSLGETLEEDELEDCMEKCPCYPMLCVLEDNNLIAKDENCDPGHSVVKVRAIAVDKMGLAFDVDFSAVLVGRGRDSINDFILNEE
jgi:hypothetical protein